MKVLGIDTSSLATSVAVIEDNKLICERNDIKSSWRKIRKNS